MTNLTHETPREEIKVGIVPETQQVQRVMIGDEVITKRGRGMLETLTKFVEGRQGEAVEFDLETSSGVQYAINFLNEVRSVFSSVPDFVNKKGKYRQPGEAEAKFHLLNEVLPAQLLKIDIFVSALKEVQKGLREKAIWVRRNRRLAYGAVTALVTLATVLGVAKSAEAASTSNNENLTTVTPDSQQSAENVQNDEALATQLESVSFSLASTFTNLENQLRALGINLNTISEEGGEINGTAENETLAPLPTSEVFSVPLSKDQTDALLAKLNSYAGTFSPNHIIGASELLNTTATFDISTYVIPVQYNRNTPGIVPDDIKLPLGNELSQGQPLYPKLFQFLLGISPEGSDSGALEAVYTVNKSADGSSDVSVVLRVTKNKTLFGLGEGSIFFVESNTQASNSSTEGIHIMNLPGKLDGLKLEQVILDADMLSQLKSQFGPEDAAITQDLMAGDHIVGYVDESGILKRLLTGNPDTARRIIALSQGVDTTRQLGVVNNVDLSGNVIGQIPVVEKPTAAAPLFVANYIVGEAKSTVDNMKAAAPVNPDVPTNTPDAMNGKPEQGSTVSNVEIKTVDGRDVLVIDGKEVPTLGLLNLKLKSQTPNPIFIGDNQQFGVNQPRTINMNEGGSPGNQIEVLGYASEVKTETITYTDVNGQPATAEVKIISVSAKEQSGETITIDFVGISNGFVGTTVDGEHYVTGNTKAMADSLKIGQPLRITGTDFFNSPDSVRAMAKSAGLDCDTSDMCKQLLGMVETYQFNSNEAIKSFNQKDGNPKRYVVALSIIAFNNVTAIAQNQ